MNLSYKKIQYLFLCLYCLASIFFFEPVFINATILKVISWIIESVLIANVFLYILFHPFGDKIAIVLRTMCIILLLSFFTSYFFHDQGFLFTIRVFLNSSFLFLFFYLKKYAISPSTIEKMILRITLVYAFLFLICLAVFPRIIFGDNGDDVQINTDRGIARVRLLGTCFLYFSYFLILNRAILYKKRKDIIFSIFLFTLILLNVSRQHILFSFLLGGWMLIVHVSLPKKIIIVSSLALFIFFAYTYIPIIQNLVALTQDQYAESGTQNVRLLAYEYYFESYNKGILPSLLGNGIPHYDSKWGISIVSIIERTGYVLSDVGYDKIYIYFGLLGLVTYFISLVLSLLKKIPRQYIYCKYYLAFIAFTTISSHSFFTDMITMAIAFYIIHIVKNREDYNTHSVDTENTVLAVAR